MNVNMSPNFELRPVTIADASALHQSLRPERSVTTIQELLQRAEDMKERARGQGLVAVNSTRVIGYGQLTLWPRTCEISDLIVAANVRGQGIGTAIILALIELARNLNMPSVEIGAAQNNPRALALYRRLGFQDSRTLDIDLGNGPEPVIYLSLELRPQ